MSKSQVNVMVKVLDQQVEDFRNRPLDAAAHTLVTADALVLKVRKNGPFVLTP